jgi:hypothetical protein
MYPQTRNAVHPTKPSQRPENKLRRRLCSHKHRFWSGFPAASASATRAITRTRARRSGFARPHRGYCANQKPTEGGIEVGKPAAGRATPGAMLVVAGVAALVLGLTGFSLHVVGFRYRRNNYGAAMRGVGASLAGAGQTQPARSREVRHHRAPSQ